MLCSKLFFTWTIKYKFVNINLEGVKTSTFLNVPWVKNRDSAVGGGCAWISQVQEVYSFLEDLGFNWFKDSHPFSPLFPIEQALLGRSNRKMQLRQGCRGRRRLRGYDEGILFLWFDEKERSLCPAWFRFSWRAHWRLFEEASFGEEGKKSHGLIFVFLSSTLLADFTFAI